MRSLHRSLGIGVLALVCFAVVASGEWDPHQDIPLWSPERSIELPPRTEEAGPFEAGQAGVDWLMAALCSWMSTEGVQRDCTTNTNKTCFGCHVQAETVFGLARSSSRCYNIASTACASPSDEDPLEWMARYISSTQRKSCIVGTFSLDCALVGVIPVDFTTVDGQPAELGSIGHYPDCGANSPPASIHPIMQSAHGGLTLSGYTKFVSATYAPNLLALADWWVTKQQGTGQWIPDRAESPVDQGESFVTGSAVMAMATAIPYGSPAQTAAYRQAADRAMVWAEGATLTTTQDKAFGLVVLREGGRPDTDPAVVALRDDLVDDQLPDGGWAERPGLGSNAYATGQALWTLLETGLDLNDVAVCGGVQWLVDNQDLDGSWPMGSTGVNTDASRPSRFTATIWPVMALGTLSPFGANLVLSAESVESCEDTQSLPVIIRHAGDSPCGLFAQSDDYTLSAVNDVGDTVVMVPSVVSLQSGESTMITMQWTRNGPAGPPGSASITTINAISEGSVLAGCPVEAETTVAIVVPGDLAPGPLGPTLRARRRGTDIRLKWVAPPQSLGGFEVLAVPCRDTFCRQTPDPTVMPTAEIRRSALGFQQEAVLSGDALLASDRLVFYKVRGVSLCSSTPGPTCDYNCSDPRHCYLGCS